MFRKSDYLNRSYLSFPKNFRFVVFKGDRRESYSIETFFRLELNSATWSNWNLYQHKDGSDRWMLEKQLWVDPTRPEIVLKGVSLCYLACWVAKRYREGFMDVGCFVEECQA